MAKKDFDAVVVGAGPNGLAAAIRLQQAGLGVLLLEAKETIGGGSRSAELTLPGFVHDVCSAVHPMALASPYFQTLPLAEYGLEFIQPPLPAAHPFDNGTAAFLSASLNDTAEQFGADAAVYHRVFDPLLRDWPGIVPNILGPLRLPKHPVALARFGLDALQPATLLAKRFQTPELRGLWAGMAAHAIQPLTKPFTSAIALVLMAVGHRHGWPIPRGGSQAIAQALGAYFRSLGGQIQTDRPVRSLRELPSARAVLLDVTPRQLLQIAGSQLSSLYRWQLARYKYGMGVFKIDWALDGPIPWAAAACRQAGTVHLGNTLEEIAASEHQISQGRHPERPYVLLAQQSLFDATRAPAGKHTAWAYCHVPNGSRVDMTGIIERQVERFAPGFRDLILARHTFDTAAMEAHNPNYIGGDISGGMNNPGQLFTRPVLRLSPYRTSSQGLYLCSSSTPPGGGVHGMCGYHAAEQALKDVF
ncbi:phytoene desaturase family protein [Hymenobacter sp. BT491]|uniref:phytoene desaturase family protein n=1 Tax=Hymenobacter sp. BT491 TaxID=2766779 RepID=UPI0016534BE3|nr:NAD(P)/FAD-dependent oxidoreductase [Hymenobacter sp. BT491]MBC6989773.1 NAD(P)/FAD-dependent oxidoreductase [Hymenobacter sp. BT491]